MIIQTLIRLIIAAASLYLLDWFGFWVWLVAHPFWNLKGAMIGIAAGTGIVVVAMLALRNVKTRKLTILGVLLVLVLISAGIAIYGKTGFAASYAEDRTAGMLWYYGYLALTTACFVTIYEITGFFLGRKSH